MRRYEGVREGHAVTVTVDGRHLNPRLDLWNHSPTGFEWGYAGSGPAQLALAILADHSNDNERALNFYQRFKWRVIANLPDNSWTLRSDEIEQILQTLEQEELPGGTT